eukprot:TRINITY_DN264_c0_g1_i1.p1 TRINITY_DN264_c0_g1~~TRINITY_DN264_c0_g1_i1.p1  ORF type:complete len:222 (-),score=80.74 TRINITY_DN264_c0_g1_i1:38-703(-)
MSNEDQRLPAHFILSPEVTNLLQGTGPPSVVKKRKKSTGPPSEEVRKNNHKLIEQRRRQKINDKIEELRELLAPENVDGFPNKSSILDSTIDSLKTLRSTYNKLVTQQKQLQEEHGKLERELDGYGIKTQPIDFNLSEKFNFDVSSVPLNKGKHSEDSESSGEEENDSALPSSKIMTRSGSKTNPEEKERLQNIIKNNSDISASQLASLFSNNNNEYRTPD